MRFREIVDLTHTIQEGMITFEAPWHPQVSVQQLGRIGMEGRESRKLEIGTHTGTHIDAPLHFVENGAGIDAAAPDVLIGEVTILDFSQLKENDALDVPMLKGVTVTPRMIFRYGWGKHWGNRKFYHDYPYLTEAAAAHLVAGGVKLLGYDTPSPDDSRISLTPETRGTRRDSPVHKILLERGVVLVEYLANLDTLADLSGWHIVALPLKIAGADGSPARVCVFR